MLNANYTALKNQSLIANRKIAFLQKHTNGDAKAN